VTIERARRQPERAVRGFGEEELLLETADAVLSVCHVAPGRSLAEIAARPGRRLGWLLGGQLGSPALALHESRELERALATANASAESASVFVCATRTHAVRA
jgi:hypothetical protein